MVSICAQELRHLTGEASRRPLSLTGGGRYDSPRFSAKYLMCTSTDTNHDIILHTELIQGLQRPGSRHCSLGCPPRTSTLITKKKPNSAQTYPRFWQQENHHFHRCTVTTVGAERLHRNDSQSSVFELTQEHKRFAPAQTHMVSVISISHKNNCEAYAI